MSTAIADLIDASADMLLKFNAPRLCVRCGVIYKERDNIGVWRCKRYHPLFNLATPRSETYRCCGRSVADDDNGCVAADHIDVVCERTLPTRCAPHTIALLEESEIRIARKHYDPASEMILIDRYDTVEKRRRSNPNRISDGESARIAQMISTRLMGK